MLDYHPTLHLVMQQESGQIQHSIPRQIHQKAHQKEKTDRMQKVESVSTVQQHQLLSGEEMEMVTIYVMHVAFITK